MSFSILIKDNFSFKIVSPIIFIQNQAEHKMSKRDVSQKDILKKSFKESYSYEILASLSQAKEDHKYCFICKLFSTRQTLHALDGFSD